MGLKWQIVSRETILCIYFCIYNIVCKSVICNFIWKGGVVNLNTITIDIVLQGLFLGVIAAVLVVAYNKLIIGKFVKALIKAEAVHPNFAKTFEQLKVKETFFIKFAMRNKGFLRKFVLEPDGETGKGCYYIPEDKLYRAGRIYGGKDVDLLMVAAVIIVLFIFFGAVVLYAPFVTEQISNFLGGF